MQARRILGGVWAAGLRAALVIVLGLGQVGYAQDLTDDFDRPSSSDLGNGWIEKSPDAFSIANGMAAKNSVTSGYRDNIAYRPASENLRDAEASSEFSLTGATIGYPQIWVRLQTDTVTTPNVADGYILYIDNSEFVGVLGRQSGSQFVRTLANIYFDTALNATDQFRMRLRATGTNPVELTGTVERFGAGGWEIIGQATVSDAAANRIETAGSVGFSGFVESGYNFDTFIRTDLGGGPPPDNPVPTTNGLAPSAIDEGSAGFALTVMGADFVNGATVRWNGAARPTTFVSDTEVSALITAADVALPGTATITVDNPLPGGGESNAQIFTITTIPGNPVPAITTLAPDNALSGGSGFALTVNGSGFIPESLVRWNGADRQTAFVSATQLTATITAADIAAAGNSIVTVFNQGPGGGTSNSATFTVTDPSPNNPAPIVAQLTPDSATEGDAGFNLVVQGQDFVADSVVRWNGADRATTFVSATQLEAAITAGDVAAAGSADVTVFTPAPGGGTSVALTFTINNAPGGGGNSQALTSISPRSVDVGSNGTQITLNGSGFTQNSVAQLDGIALQTTFVSSSQLLADIDSGLIGSGMRSAVTVRTPDAVNVVTTPQPFFVLESDEVLFSDNFNRANDPDIGNGWTEKMPNVFSLNDGMVSGISTPSFGFNHLITYRPAAEDAQNIEVGMEFVRQPGATSLYPQVHARVQRDTVAEPGLLRSYTFFFDSYSGNGQVHITPIEDWYECYIATWDLTQPFVEGERYRLRFQVTGSNPVQMVGYMDWLNEDFWEVIAWGTVLHDQNTQQVPGGFCNTPGMIPPITEAGSTGFAKWRDPSDNYDNYYTIRLGATPNPLPATSGLSPSNAQTGSSATTVAVQGSGFIPGSVVRWDGADRSTTYVSDSELRVDISAADLSAAGNVSVTVFNPGPGGGVSNAQIFNIVDPVGNPVPNLTSMTPDTVNVGGAGFTLLVDGDNFVPGSVVRWNGVDRATTYLSGTQLQAAIDAADVANAGVASVTVFNPAPGGGTSGELTLTIIDQSTDLFDDFYRPDSTSLVVVWIEKTPESFSIVNGAAVKNAGTAAYRDNIVYRPAAEDVLDVEASAEFSLTGATIGYPQVWARLQSNTAAAPNVADGYVLYVDNSSYVGVLGRQLGSEFVWTLSNIYFTEVLNTTDRFRLRLRATGNNPVQLAAYVERFGQSGWEIIGQANATDGSANRIDTAGSVGFSGYVEGGYEFDNFTRLSLQGP